MTTKNDTINSWQDLLSEEDTEYDYVEVGKRKVRIGTLSAADMLQWLLDNEDPEKKKTNGLVLVTKSLVDDDGKRIGNLDEVTRLREKHPKTVKKLIQAAVKLNDLAPSEVSKNESSETQPGVSRTVSA